MIGWLVNDRLTCIPDTKTFWHDLLEWFPKLQDKTNGYTDFRLLPDAIEKMLQTEQPPDYIIRNATFFRKLRTDVKTISYLQDKYTDSKRFNQLDVCNSSEITVCNSRYIYNAYSQELRSRVEIIPIGTDFNHFCSTEYDNKLDILPDSVLYVGSNDMYTKRFWIIENLINDTNLNFCLVMKDQTRIDHPRVKVFNMIDHNVLKQIYNQCSILVCPSRVETLHLAGIEAGACETPIVATDVGIYHDLKNDQRWGRISKEQDFERNIKEIMANIELYDPRTCFLEADLNREACKSKWISLLES